MDSWFHSQLVLCDEQLFSMQTQKNDFTMQSVDKSVGSVSIGQNSVFNENNKGTNKSTLRNRNTFQNDVSHDDIIQSPEQYVTENPLLASQQQDKNAPLQICITNASP